MSSPDKAPIPPFFHMFTFMWLGFCALFVLVAISFFVFGLHSYFSFEESPATHEGPSLAFAMGSAGIVLFGVGMFVAGRSLFSRFETTLRGETTGKSGEDRPQQFEYKS